MLFRAYFKSSPAAHPSSSLMNLRNMLVVGRIFLLTAMSRGSGVAGHAVGQMDRRQPGEMARER